MHPQPQSCSRRFVRDFVRDLTESTAKTVRAFCFIENLQPALEKAKVRTNPASVSSHRCAGPWNAAAAAGLFSLWRGGAARFGKVSLKGSASSACEARVNLEFCAALLARLYEKSRYLENISVPWVKIWTMKPMHGQGWTSPGHLFVWF